MSRHLLVVGAQRCGTTWLTTALDAHPEVTMARPARPEPKVFCDDSVLARGAGWYRDEYFAHATDELVLGEKSTSYLEDPLAPARAAAVLGVAHVAVVLRDPVQRAVSNWRFSTEHGLETRPLEDALRANLAGRMPPWDPGRTSVSPFAYLERGRYADYLEPWRSAFPETLHVLFLPELLGDDEALRGLWGSLGVDPARAPERPAQPVNSSTGPAPELSPDLRRALEEYFEVSDRVLSADLGRSLPW